MRAVPPSVVPVIVNSGAWMNGLKGAALSKAAFDSLPVVGPAICRAVEAAGGWQAGIRPGDRVLVKPNCISNVLADRPAQTHPAVIVEVCRQLLDYGARPFVGDSPAWGSLIGNLRILGVLDDLARLGVPVVPFKRPVVAIAAHC